MRNAAAASVIFVCVAWAAWALLWALLSVSTKSTVRQEGLLSRALHLVPLGVACLLLLSPWLAGTLLGRTILPRAAWMAFLGAALVAAGLAFAVWARLVLAGNWSGTVTLKAAHELVRTGPYAWARHPIYTGLLTALLGTVVVVDAWRGVLAFVIVAASFLRKMRTEETFMRAAFGVQYEAYRTQTKALIPFIW